MAAKYSYNPRDIKFILKEWLPMEEILNYPRYRDYYSMDDLDVVVEQMNRLCRDMLAPTNDDGENNPPHFVDGRVKLAPSFGPAFKYFQENGWGSSNYDETAEGVLPYLLVYAMCEMACAATPSWTYMTALTSGAALLIQKYGSQKVKETFLPLMFGGKWSGCMCLTEPPAGSDVGAVVSRAYPTSEEGVYKIKGGKIFITYGDGDHAENIVYLTLARIEGAAEGTKGLSLFVVPRFWPETDGTLQPNDVATVGMEHKLGIKGSATVTLAYGDNDGCQGYILGDPPDKDGKGQGMAQMFDMMNKERLEAGMISVGIAANEYWNASQYAQDRIQGAPISNPRGARVPIIEHEDVKRMLMQAKAWTEGCRAMLMKTYYYLDMSKNDPDPGKREWAHDRLECLTPVCKAYPSDEVWPLMGEIIQIYGGYGFTEEYPAARAARDCKINSLYEGTNYIQALDMIGRKWPLKKGQAFASLLDEIQVFVDNHKGQAQYLDGDIQCLQRALDAYRNMQMQVMGFVGEGKIQLMAYHARRILNCTGRLLCAYHLMEQAFLALNNLAHLDSSHYDYHFYSGKVASARYFVNNILPEVWLLAECMAFKDDSTAMASPEIFKF